jgi:hypothetical protein
VDRIRVRAPQLHGRRWLNTGGIELSLADLRGKVVLLEFWTFCWVNCLHVLDELRELEERFRDVLVVIGSSASRCGSSPEAPGELVLYLRTDRRGRTEMDSRPRIGVPGDQPARLPHLESQ